MPLPRPAGPDNSGHRDAAVPVATVLETLPPDVIFLPDAVVLSVGFMNGMIVEFQRRAAGVRGGSFADLAVIESL